MKQIWKTEDRALERLLRGHVSQQSGPKVCKQFDPDLANAYIEHNLTPANRDGFEQHLSLCAGCRTATVALARLAENDAPLPARPIRQARQGWGERLSSLARAMTAPRWALAATAVLVAAVSIPVVMSRLSVQDQTPSSAAPASAANVQQANPPTEPDKQSGAVQATSGAGVVQSHGSVDLVVQNPGRNRSPMVAGASGGLGSQPPAVAVNQPESEPAPVPADPRSADQVEKKEQAAGAVADQVQSREQVANAVQQAPSPQQQAGPGDQLAKIDPQGARPAAEAEKDSAHLSVLKTGRADGEVRAAGGTKIRPEDNNAPPSPIVGAEAGARRALAQPSSSSMRDGRRLSETVRARGTAERKVGKKRFWLRDEIWTDNDYKPEKEMPMVTLVRDSDVFKEVIGKRAALKGYLTAFAENERAIVVYKGTIYKLIPQDGNK